MSIPLRPYQESAMEAVRQASREGRRRTVVNLPTGTGKTVLGLSLALAAYRRGNRSLWLAHRNELIDQPYRAARALGFPADDIGIVKAERDECSASLVIGCTPTLWNPERLARLNESGKPFSIVIADEAHHFASLSNRALLSGLLGDPHVLGLTATLERADRASLAKIFPGGIAYQLPLMRAIADGWLVDFRPAIAIDVPELDLSGVAVSASTGDYVQDDLRAEFQKALTALNAAAVDAWIEHARPSGRTGIFFCLYVEQAMRLRDALRAAGVSTAECVSGETPDDERKAILEGLAEGAVECVTNVGVLTEGYDCPRVNAVVMCRATKSKALYIQCLGRGLRPFPRGAKTDCMVIDLVGNSGAHSSVQAAMLIEDLEEPTQSNRDPQSCSTPGCAGANARTVKRDGEETILCYDCEPPKTPVVALRAKKTWVNWVPVPRYGALAASGPNYSTVIVWPVGENWRAAVWSNRVRTDLTDGPVWEDLAMSLADDAARRMEAKSLMKKSANWRDCAASEKQISALRKWKVMDIPSGTTAGLASDLMTVAVAEASLRGAGALLARKV